MSRFNCFTTAVNGKAADPRTAPACHIVDGEPWMALEQQYGFLAHLKQKEKTVKHDIRYNHSLLLTNASQWVPLPYGNQHS